MSSVIHAGLIVVSTTIAIRCGKKCAMLLIHNTKALFEESWNSRRQEAVKYLAFVIVALWITAAFFKHFKHSFIMCSTFLRLLDMTQFNELPSINQGFIGKLVVEDFFSELSISSLVSFIIQT